MINIFYSLHQNNVEHVETEICVCVFQNIEEREIRSVCLKEREEERAFL